MGRNDHLQRDLIARAGLDYEAAHRSYVRAWQWLEETNKGQAIEEHVKMDVRWQFGSGVGGYEDIVREVQVLVNKQKIALLKEAVKVLGEKREAALRELQLLCSFSK